MEYLTDKEISLIIQALQTTSISNYYKEEAKQEFKELRDKLEKMYPEL